MHALLSAYIVMDAPFPVFDIYEEWSFPSYCEGKCFKKFSEFGQLQQKQWF